MPWDSFAKGYDAARNHWQNRRSEAARAFSEFRSMHPNATYQDYRSFVDGITGGNSFVRGGIPADQILQSMAQENQRRAQQQQMQQQMEMLRYQAQTAGTIGALAERYAGMYENDAEVEDMLVGNLGGSDFARQQVRSMFKTGFSPIRERARFNAVKDNLPLALQMLEANPDTDLSSMFPDMPKSFVSGLSDAARKKYDESRRTKLNSAATELLQRGKTVIDMGGQPDFNGYDDEVVRIVRPQLDAYNQKTTSERQAAEKQKRVENLKAMVDDLKRDPGFVAEMSKPGFNPLAILTQRAQQYGITDLAAEEAAPYIQDLQEDSVAAKKAVLDQQREAQLNATREAFGTGQGLAVESFVKELENDESALFKRAGPYAGAAAFAVKTLGTVYDLTDRNTRSVIAGIISSDYLESKGIDPANSAEVEQAIINHPDFKTSARTISSSRASREAVIESSTSLPSDLMTFDSWLSDYQGATAAAIKDIEEKEIAPLLKESSDLSSTVKIDATINTLNQLKLTIYDTITKAAQASDLWLIPGSGSFDAEAASQAGAARIYEIQALIDRLNAEKSSIIKRAEGQNRAANDAARAANAHGENISRGMIQDALQQRSDDITQRRQQIEDSLFPSSPLEAPGRALDWIRNNVRIGGEPHHRPPYRPQNPAIPNMNDMFRRQ